MTVDAKGDGEKIMVLMVPCFAHDRALPSASKGSLDSGLYYPICSSH